MKFLVRFAILSALAFAACTASAADAAPAESVATAAAAPVEIIVGAVCALIGWLVPSPIGPVLARIVPIVATLFGLGRRAK